ncbi:MAG: NAD(P)H-binding protein, partial [Myxococcales bacterium]|nr:NAD(P)H-binding protein [Myxococcales bacterium]
MNQPSSQPGAQTDAARVLVTGANGQIGRRLIERLARSNPRVAVRALVRSERAAETLQGFPVEIRPEISVVDYRNAEELAEAARDCRYAVHLVGILKQTSNSRYQDAHEASTRAMADAAASDLVANGWVTSGGTHTVGSLAGMLDSSDAGTTGGQNMDTADDFINSPFIFGDYVHGRMVQEFLRHFPTELNMECYARLAAGNDENGSGFGFLEAVG